MSAFGAAPLWLAVVADTGATVAVTPNAQLFAHQARQRLPA
jgi:cation transport ATPase